MGALMLVMLGAASPDAGAESGWNQWLGGQQRGNAATSTSQYSNGVPDFEELWRVPLGSGYSAVSVRGTSIATMINDGNADYAVVLDAGTGRERWRTKVGRRYKGHDGSIDGPLSTPGLDDDSVYAISPRGKLYCFDLLTGKTLWKKNLKSQFGAQEPHYGFATSPLLVGDKVIAQAGGKGLFGSGHLVALERRTGATVWCVGPAFLAPRMITRNSLPLKLL
jgi:outer membrane protein assembly factor BamB